MYFMYFKSLQNFVPAVAGIRKGQAFFRIYERKGCVAALKMVSSKGLNMID
jgi:hypothetical protein